MNSTAPTEQPKVPNTYTPSSKPKANSPILWLFAFILVGLGGFIIGKSFTTSQPVPLILPSPIQTAASPDPYTDWKIYKDKEQKIEFKYPNNWYAVRYEPMTFSIFLDASPFQIPEATEFITPIHVGYNEAINTTTNENFYMEKTLAEGIVRYKNLFDSQTVQVIENLSIDGKEAAQISGKFGPGPFESEYSKYTLIQLDNKLLVVHLFGNKYHEIYDQILSTFTFLNEEKIVCGGPVLTPCPEGYTCQLQTIKSGDVEETSGTCVKN